MKIYKNAVKSRIKNKKIIVHHNTLANGVQLDIVGLYDKKLIAAGANIIEAGDNKFICTNSLCITQEVFDTLLKCMIAYDANKL